MKEVQIALKDLGIPVSAGYWKPTAQHKVAPQQYIVYSTTTTEDVKYDDGVHRFRTYVYMDLWSEIDPTDIIMKVRAMMYGAGFFMVEESDKGYNQTSYDYQTEQYDTHWTWVIRTEVEYGNGD